MRIISGELKRHRFSPPKGFPSRPTTDFAKEGLFNLLVNEVDLEELEILDLFTGTGNISFEFASRQAGKIVSVDKNFKCIRFIREFIQKYNLEDRITPVKADAIKYIERSGRFFDLIFADPPYALVIHEKLIDKVMEGILLHKNGLFVLEHGGKTDFSSHANFVSSRKFGHVIFSFFRHNH